MISFVHYKNTPNLGDVMSAPYHYFDFPDAQAFNLGDPIPPCDAVIYGGGAIEPELRAKGIHRSVDAPVKIAWGIGTSRGGHTTHGQIVQDLDLCGIREFGRENGQRNTFWTPCSSCMSPEFDKVRTPQYEYVFYAHGKFEFPIDFGDSPAFDNRAQTLGEALDFLGSGETIVTNSYHGTYWGLLLNRRVVCIPFSSKFYGFKHPPAFCTDGKWKRTASSAISYSGAIDECREANLSFHARVMDRLASTRHTIG